MFLGRVTGNIVCTIKDPALAGRKLLIVQPLDRSGRDKGRALIAVDSVGAGAGDKIYWCRGREAGLGFPPDGVPTEATIVGIVDEVHMEAPQ
jgi:ethanolamine utilization protein EutN